MALSVTSAPWQQVSMPALDLRRYLGAGLQEGVASATDMAVAQRGAGANFSVDIAAGEALIQGDTVSNQGRYYVLNDAVFNLTGFTTANATNPRIDRVTLRVRDAFHGDAANDVSFQIVTGTATAGATLANLNGAAAVPNSQLLLANILIPATATTVTTANIDTTVRQRVFSLSQIAPGTNGQVITTIAGAVVWGAGGPSYVTSLPGSPADGQEAILVDSLTAPTYQWRFRFNNGSTNTDKWEYVGGAAAVVEVATSESTTSATYAALTTAGPSFTVPRAGVYVVEIGAAIANAANIVETFMSYDIGATGAVDADAIQKSGQLGAGHFDSVHNAHAKSGLAASTVLVSKYKSDGSNAGQFKNRWMRVTPVRVS